MINNIFTVFKNSIINIKCEQKLQEYVNFCIDNNQNDRIQGKTSHHHILPNKLFPEYSNLKENDWNGSHLLYSDHYYAHWLLTESIDEFTMLYAFCAMHNKDFANNRLSVEDLINPNDFQNKMQERGIKHSLYLTNTHNGCSIAKTAAKKMMETKLKPIIINGVETTIYKESIAKRIKTMTAPIILDGVVTTIYKESSKKYSKTMKEEYLNDDFQVTTKAKERSKKYSKTVTAEFIDLDGNVTTKAKERAKIVSSKLIASDCNKGENNSNAKIIAIYDNNDNIVAVSRGNFIDTCTRLQLPSNLLAISYRTGVKIFTSNNGRRTAINTGREHLIGYYAVILKEESDIIQEYGFEPKDVMGKVQQKAKDYFFAVEQL